MGFRSRLTEWYKMHHRALPWRETSDPYRIWVSEVILQQTRVNQGMDYYRRFLESFPDIHALAAASEEEVLKVWQGLGYYSRARNMHHAAKTVVNEYQGQFPDKYHDILALKGIGEYTASAVASIAFNLPHPVLDGNVLRFISRLKGVVEPVDTSKGKQLIRDVLEYEMDKETPGLFNQALMEFGALVCAPKNPDCERCPFRNDCVARNTGYVDKIPVKGKKQPPSPRYFHYLVIILRKDNQMFTVLNKRSGKDIWKNLYEFPVIEADTMLDWDMLTSNASFREIFRGQIPELLKVSNPYRHVLSHRILHARYFVVSGDSIPGNHLQVAVEQLDRYPVSRLMAKMLDSLNITFYE